MITAATTVRLLHCDLTPPSHVTEPVASQLAVMQFMAFAGQIAAMGVSEPIYASYA